MVIYVINDCLLGCALGLTSQTSVLFVVCPAGPAPGHSQSRGTMKVLEPLNKALISCKVIVETQNFSYLR